MSQSRTLQNQKENQFKLKEFKKIMNSLQDESICNKNDKQRRIMYNEKVKKELEEKRKEEEKRFKILFILSDLFFGVNYTLLLLLNPGIPTNKNNLDPSIPQNGYKQCSECNCIFMETEGKYTIHCERCNICVDCFDHHCTFATKCIGKKNKIIFKLWLYSIPILFLASFFYLIF